MNTDNNLSEASKKTDVKCRFFAQYWGQNILGSTHFKNKKAVIFNYDLFGSLKTNNNIISAEESFNTYFLNLKPLSKYTDEDAIAVEKIWRKSDCRIEIYYENAEKYKNEIIVGRNLIKYWLEECKLNFQARIDYRTIQHITDYLRSKGYAVPFMEYSVEDLVSFGWVRLV